MNYLIISTLFIATCLSEIVFSQSIYNKQLYDRMFNNKGIGTTAVQPKWINQESLINVETILETWSQILWKIDTNLCQY